MLGLVHKLNKVRLKEYCISYLPGHTTFVSPQAILLNAVSHQSFLLFRPGFPKVRSVKHCVEVVSLFQDNTYKSSDILSFNVFTGFLLGLKQSKNV